MFGNNKSIFGGQQTTPNTGLFGTQSTSLFGNPQPQQQQQGGLFGGQQQQTQGILLKFFYEMLGGLFGQSSIFGQSASKLNRNFSIDIFFFDYLYIFY